MSFLREASKASNPAPIALQNPSGGGALFGGASSSLPRRGSPEMLQLWASSPWLRRGCDVLSHQGAIARWSILAPPQGASRRRALQLKSQVASYLDFEERQGLVKHLTDQGDLRQIYDHPFLRMQNQGVIGAPWLEMDGYAVAALGIVSRVIAGEEFQLLVRDEQGIPVAWYPIPSPWMELPSKRVPFFMLKTGSTRTPVPPEDVVYQKIADPSNPYGRGGGTAMAVDHDIEIEEQASSYLASILRNRARPDLLIMGPGIGGRESAEMQEEWMGRLSGKLQQGLVHFLGIPPSVKAGEVTIKDLNRSAADMEMSRMRKDERDVILLVLGVPPAAIGVIENSNRAVATAAKEAFREYGTLPVLESRRRFLQSRFFDQRGSRPPEYKEDRLLLHYELPPLVDTALQVELMKALPHAYPIDDIREVSGKPRIPNGHLHGVPLNFDLRPLDEVVRADKTSQPAEKSERIAAAIAEVAQGRSVQDVAQSYALNEEERATLGNVLQLLHGSPS